MPRPAGSIPEILLETAKTVTDECLYPLDRGKRTPVSYDGHVTPASRLQWELVTGESPGPLMVLHTCGNGSYGCLNFGHLYLGTQADNHLDRCLDGLAARGLDEDRVRAIRSRAAEGVGTMALTREFGVTKRTIRQVVTRKTWAWLD
jgi:hypothetical protein